MKIIYVKVEHRKVVNDSLVILHFYVITRYESFFAFKFGSKPIHVIFHVDHLQHTHIHTNSIIKTEQG